MREERKVWASLFVGLVGAFASACGGTQSTRPASEERMGVGVGTMTPWAEMDFRIRQQGVTETIFGTDLRDPYRALEEDS